jgi:uncharacterized protein (DUF58 family)
VSLPPEILKKVKLLEISTRKLVNNLFAGEYHTAFKGQGMTFADFREYVPGDDIRHISWALTARTGKPFIKKFDEEREMTLMLLVDISGSTDFGSRDLFKGEVMAHLAALLAFSAAKNNDQVGLLLFSDQVEHFVPPKKGHGHVQRLLRDLYYHEPKSRETKLEPALRFLQGVLKKKAAVFVMSDFFDSNYDEPLRMLGRKHDVVSVVVRDQFERGLPSLGLMDLWDNETGEIVTVDTSSASFKKSWGDLWMAKDVERDKLLRQSQVDRIDVWVNGDFVDPLVKYFKSRQRR